MLRRFFLITVLALAIAASVSAQPTTLPSIPSLPSVTTQVPKYLTYGTSAGEIFFVNPTVQGTSSLFFRAPEKGVVFTGLLSTPGLGNGLRATTGGSNSYWLFDQQARGVADRFYYKIPAPGSTTLTTTRKAIPDVFPSMFVGGPNMPFALLDGSFANALQVWTNSHEGDLQNPSAVKECLSLAFGLQDTLYCDDRQSGVVWAVPTDYGIPDWQRRREFYRARGVVGVATDSNGYVYIGAPKQPAGYQVIQFTTELFNPLIANTQRVVATGWNPASSQVESMVIDNGVLYLASVFFSAFDTIGDGILAFRLDSTNPADSRTLVPAVQGRAIFSLAILGYYPNLPGLPQP